MLIGLVGKPSVGKSSVFQALTSVPVARADYPFTTIEPNKGVGFVEVECVDKDFNVQCNPRSGFCINGRRFVPVQILDVAGLVPGAHEGKGLGNKFLDDLRQADVFIHIIDASGSTNEGGEKVPPGSYDPVNDVTFLEKELDYWIKGILDANWGKIARDISEKPEEKLAKQLSGLGVTIQHVKHAIHDKQLTEWSDEELLDFCRNIRKASKPIVIAANKCDMPGAFANYERIKKQFPDYLVVPCSASGNNAENSGKSRFCRLPSWRCGFQNHQAAFSRADERAGIHKKHDETAQRYGSSKMPQFGSFRLPEIHSGFSGRSEQAFRFERKHYSRLLPHAPGKHCS